MFMRMPSSYVVTSLHLVFGFLCFANDSVRGHHGALPLFSPSHSSRLMLTNDIPSTIFHRIALTHNVLVDNNFLLQPFNSQRRYLVVKWTTQEAQKTKVVIQSISALCLQINLSLAKQNCQEGGSNSRILRYENSTW